MKTPMIYQIQLPTMAHNTVCLIKDLDYLEVAHCTGNIKARSLDIVHYISSYLIQYAISCACVNV